jgi:oligopeptidase B
LQSGHLELGVLCRTDEEILLDENKEAAKHSYYQVASVSVSENTKLMAYSEDTVGSERYSLAFVDIATRKSLLQRPITNTAGHVEWAADNTTFFYVELDEKHRPYKVQCPQAEGPVKTRMQGTLLWISESFTL